MEVTEKKSSGKEDGKTKADPDERKTKEIKQESTEGPLMVAMQPGTEEVVADDVHEVVVPVEGTGTEDEEGVVLGAQEEIVGGEESAGDGAPSTPLHDPQDDDTLYESPSKSSRYSSSPSPSPRKTGRRGRPSKSKSPAASPAKPTVPYVNPHNTRGVILTTIKQEQLTSEDESDEDGSGDDSGRQSVSPQRSPIMERYHYPATRRSRRQYHKPKVVPKKRAFAYRLQWRNKDMLDAMHGIMEKKMTIRGAAKKYHVPYSTLKDRVHGRVQHGARPGVKTVLSPEEEEDLVRYVKDLEATGFQLRCIDIRERAGEILHLNRGHNSPYRECSPGHNWLTGFIKRHPGMEFKKSLAKPIVPNIQKQKAICRKFYESLFAICKKQKVNNRPDRIYAVSEIRLRGCIDSSVLMCSSADGTILAPFVVFRGNRIRLTEARETFPDAFFTSSADGKINERILLWWFRDHFLKKLQIAGPSHRPCVLLLSRPVNEITFQLAQLGREEKIILVGIPQTVTHLLQPLDDGLNVNVQQYMTKKYKRWQDENPGASVSQRVYAELIHKVWRKCLNSDDISRRFARNGIYPMNDTAISSDRIFSASIALKESLDRRSPSPEPMPAEAIGSTEPEEDDSMFSGLNLLSTLSSHEYATLSTHHRHPSVGGTYPPPGTRYSYSTRVRLTTPPPQESPSRDEEQMSRHVRREARRAARQAQEALEREHMEMMRKRSTTYYQADDGGGSNAPGGPAAFGEKALLQHLLQTNGPLPAHPKPRPTPTAAADTMDIQDALRQAKTEDQINRAIQSIEGGGSSPIRNQPLPQRRGRGRPRKYPDFKPMVAPANRTEQYERDDGLKVLHPLVLSDPTGSASQVTYKSGGASSVLTAGGLVGGVQQEVIECEEVTDTTDMFIDSSQQVLSDAPLAATATVHQTDDGSVVVEAIEQGDQSSYIDDVEQCPAVVQSDGLVLEELQNTALTSNIGVRSYIIQENGTIVEEVVDDTTRQQVIAQQQQESAPLQIQLLPVGHGAHNADRKKEEEAAQLAQAQLAEVKGGGIVYPVSTANERNDQDSAIQSLSLEATVTSSMADTTQMADGAFEEDGEIPDLEHIEEVTDASPVKSHYSAGSSRTIHIGKGGISGMGMFSSPATSSRISSRATTRLIDTGDGSGVKVVSRNLSGHAYRTPSATALGKSQSATRRVQHATPQMQHAISQSPHPTPQVRHITPQSQQASPQVHRTMPQSQQTAPQVHQPTTESQDATPTASTSASSSGKKSRIQVIRASQLKDLISSGRKVQVIRMPKRKADQLTTSPQGTGAVTTTSDGSSSGGDSTPQGVKIIKVSRQQLQQLQQRQQHFT